MQHYLTESRRLDVAVLLATPLFVLYQLGLILFTEGGVRNAAEIFLLHRILGLSSHGGMLVLNALVLAAFMVAALLRQNRPPAPGLFALVIVESSLYALLVAPAVMMIQNFGRTLMAPRVREICADVVYGVGAGLWEELLFRLVGVAGGFFLLKRLLKVDPVWATVVAVIGSSLAFSAFHHMGVLGEPFSPAVFSFRFLAGVMLGLLFVYRGLAVACWTHALYDVWVVLAFQ